MTLRTIITDVLIWMSIPIMIIWKYWEGQYWNTNFWVSGYNYPLNVQWTVLFLTVHVRDMFLSCVIFNLSNKIRSIRTPAIFNLTYSVIDTLLFFWSFNRGKDVLLVHYTITVAVSLLFVFFPKIKRALSTLKTSAQHIVNHRR